MTKNIVAIGSSPSSGSTLLADIIDSQPFYTCGSETALLTVLSQLPRFKSLELCRSFVTHDICKQRLYLDWNGLCEYGINPYIFNDIWSQNPDPTDFLDVVVSRYFALRGKPANSIFFEKTPMNAAYAKDILNIKSVMGFIFIVRNPFYTVTSMIKRGYSAFSAAASWLQSATIIENLASAGKLVAVVRYEDLVSDPTSTLTQIKAQLGIISGWIDTNDILENYLSSTYRLLVSRRTVNAWKITQYGDIRSANKGVTRGAYDIVNKLLNYRLSKKALDFYGFKEAPTMRHLMAKYHYSSVVNMSELCEGASHSPSRFFRSLIRHTARAVSTTRTAYDSILADPALALSILRLRNDFVTTRVP